MRLALISLLIAAAWGCGKVSTTRCERAGFDDCNNDPADGCEADLASASSCGSCGNVCQAPAGGAPTCLAGACSFDCGTNLIACGDACVARCNTVFDAPGTQPFVVPDRCVRVRVKAWGAGGGNGTGNTNAAAGGFGVVELAVTPGESLTVVVGAPGRSAQQGMPGAGGAPGGGNGGSGSNRDGGGGGGFSGAFAGSVEIANAIDIAGGGGGSGGASAGSNGIVPGAGGGASGQDGGGRGGTQVDGFGALAGGPGASQGSGDGGGGGGGGWFGGHGGPGANSDAGGGGGGAGFAATRATFQLLVAGNRQTPGNSVDPDRGTAGAPGMPGKVVLDCLP